MLQNYLKIAYRNISRNKAFSIINIAGLALGMAVFLLMAQYVAFEWGANRFHKNFDRLYRGVAVSKNDNSTYLAPGFAAAIQKKFPSVESAIRVADGIGAGVISYNSGNGEAKTFREENILYVEGDFFKTFSFPIISGNSSLQQQKTLAISESMARKYFGKTDIIGQTLTVSNQFGNTPYTITAVVKDIPQSSDIKSDIFLSIHTLESAANRDENDWADPNTLESGFVSIYFLLNKNANAESVAKQATAYIHSLSPSTKDAALILQPFKNLHLAPGFNYPYQTFGSFTLVASLASISLLILLIAWVNYINLSTAQSLKRGRESGVRKVLGASRLQLAAQFLSETFLLTVLSMALALVLVQIFQPLFNQFTGKDLSLSVLQQGWFLFAAFILLVIGSLLSGGYVAFVLSSMNPISIIKGKTSSPNSFPLRKGLVVFQFCISIIFIIATMVFYQQLRFMKNEDLGMSLSQLLVIKGPTISSDGQAENNKAFKQQLAGLSFVKKYAASNNVPGRGYNFSTQNITRQVPQPGDDKKSYNMFISDEKYFDTYGITFSQGKAFSELDAANGWGKAQKVIINEKAAAQLGFSKDENIVGKKIVWQKEYEIVGVIKDYHHLSLRQSIEPVIYLPSVSFVYFTVQTDVNNMPAKLATLKKLYGEYFSGNPFEFFFADESFDQQYNAEQKLGSIFISAALLAIFIACLGLFGLAAFSAQQRTKEIGIRKVLGASVTNVVTMLSKDFIKMVIIATFIAFPISWWLMNKWLQDFAYQIQLSWWIFASAGLITVFIALATISYQAIKAAIANPVKSLRNE